MRQSKIFINRMDAGTFEELENGQFQFTYHDDYKGPPISLTMPLNKREYVFNHFPAFFEGLLPEGIMLEGLLRQYKLDKHDLFGQLIQVGHDLVGAVTVEAIK